MELADRIMVFPPSTYTLLPAFKLSGRCDSAPTTTPGFPCNTAGGEPQTAVTEAATEGKEEEADPRERQSNKFICNRKICFLKSNNETNLVGSMFYNDHFILDVQGPSRSRLSVQMHPMRKSFCLKAYLESNHGKRRMLSPIPGG